MEMIITLPILAVLMQIYHNSHAVFVQDSIFKGASCLVLFEDYYLSVPPLFVTNVKGGLPEASCLVKCMEEENCLSFNVASLPSHDEGFRCEILPTDKYNASSLFNGSNEFHHYGFKSACVSMPCYNNATCLTSRTDGNYNCACSAEFYGRNCDKQDWYKLNTSPVCFGAKNNSYGEFTAVKSGQLLRFKFVHLSGKVGCATNRGSYWGCDWGESSLAFLITTDNNNFVFPNTNRRFTLPGLLNNSPILELPEFTPVMVVTAHQSKFRIWYREDFGDTSEQDNWGNSCTDVYAKYEE